MRLNSYKRYGALCKAAFAFAAVCCMLDMSEARENAAGSDNKKGAAANGAANTRKGGGAAQKAVTQEGIARHINPNAPVVKVGGSVIKESDITEAINQLPAELIANLTEPQVRAVVLKSLIREKLLQREADTAHIEQDASVKRRMSIAAKKVAADAYLKKVVDARVTDIAVRQRYQKVAEKFKEQKEYKLSLIVCDTKAKADDAIKELKNKSFADVAKKFSVLPDNLKDKAAEGTFIYGMLLPQEVLKQLESLKDGESSKTAIKTKNGFYIFKRLGVRQAKVPSIQELASHIKTALKREQVELYFVDLEKKSTITYYNEDYKREIAEQDRMMAEARRSASAAVAAGN